MFHAAAAASGAVIFLAVSIFVFQISYSHMSKNWDVVIIPEINGKVFPTPPVRVDNASFRACTQDWLGHLSAFVHRQVVLLFNKVRRD